MVESLDKSIPNALSRALDKNFQQMSKKTPLVAESVHQHTATALTKTVTLEDSFRNTHSSPSEYPVCFIHMEDCSIVTGA